MSARQSREGSFDGSFDSESRGSFDGAYNDGRASLDDRSSCSSDGMYMRQDNGVDGDGAYASAPEVYSHEGSATYSRGGSGTSS